MGANFLNILRMESELSVLLCQDQDSILFYKIDSKKSQFKISNHRLLSGLETKVSNAMLASDLFIQ